MLRLGVILIRAKKRIVKTLRRLWPEVVWAPKWFGLPTKESRLAVVLVAFIRQEFFMLHLSARNNVSFLYWFA
jgi:hypothetical protein